MQPMRLIRTLAGKRLDWTLAACALLVALLPSRALIPWTDDLARLVSVPLAPVTHLGIFLRDRIRPTRAEFDRTAPETLALEREANQYRMLYEQTRLEVDRLERSLSSIRAVSARSDGAGTRFADASVIARDPSRTDGVLTLNAGVRHGVIAGSAALVDGDLFVGIVAPELGNLSSTLIPSHKLPGIRVRVLPAEGSDPRTPLANYPGAILKPTGRGTWTAEVASSMPLAAGMLARLADDRFPRAALGARVGVVTAVAPIEQAPLARRIEVRPLIETAELSTVVLVVPAEAPR